MSTSPFSRGTSDNLGSEILQFGIVILHLGRGAGERGGGRAGKGGGVARRP